MVTFHPLERALKVGSLLLHEDGSHKPVYILPVVAMVSKAIDHNIPNMMIWSEYFKLFILFTNEIS